MFTGIVSDVGEVLEKERLGERDRIIEACQTGRSTMFGTGISPGFAELLAIVSATICDRVDKITVNEAADTTFYDSPATEIPVEIACRACGAHTILEHPVFRCSACAGSDVAVEHGNELTITSLVLQEA